MAVVTFTVTVTGKKVSITPDPGAVTFVAGDFLIFNRAPGTTQDVVVKVVAGSAGPTIVTAVAGDRRVTVDPITKLNGDGDVMITLSDAGGAKGGFPP